MQHSFLQKELIQVLLGRRLPAHIPCDGHDLQVADLLYLLGHFRHSVKFRTERVFCGLCLVLQMFIE